MYLETFLLLLIYFLLVFIIGQVQKNNSLVDIAWGSGFVLSALYNFIQNPNWGLKGIFVTLCISIWGIRLTYHIAKRNLGKPEDYRYVNMRAQWGNNFVWSNEKLNSSFL